MDIAKTLKSKNYTGERMYRDAQNFFVSLGWPELPNSFWKKSIFKGNQDGKEISCNSPAMAVNMFKGKEYRLGTLS